MSKTKKTICLVLLAAIIILVISPTFLGVNESYAVEIPNVGDPDIAPKTSPPPQKSEETLKSEVDKLFISQTSQAVESPCGWWPFSGTCLNYYTAWFMFNIVFRATNWLTWAGGMVFNAAIFFSLSGEAFDTTQNSLISTGWKATRDFANLFFIFIILYIAIATILQLSGYGSKSLLIKVIIVALLINFSLMITKVVIDASHVLAWEFYNKIDVSGGGQYQVVNKEETGIKIKEDVGLREETDKKDLSAVFMAGFNVQKMVGGQAQHDKQREILQSGRGVVGAFWDIILIYFLGSIVNLIAAFILFAGGILFIIRVVVLWFVMILAPLAFVGMILPGKMAGFAKTWWDKLFSQAFFAPAFLFLFYLVTVMIDSKFLQGMITSANSAGDEWYGDTLVVIFHFIIIGGLTIGCLIIAKQMGAWGADTMIGWSKKLQGAAQGYAGRIGMAPLKGARRGAGFFGEKVATGKGRVAGILRKVPGATQLGAYMSSKNREKIDELQKSYAKYSNKELENTLGGPMGVGFNRTAIIQELAKRKSLKDIADKHVQKATTIMERYEKVEEKKGADRLRPELVKGDVNKYMTNLKKEHEDDPTNIAKKTQYNDALATKTAFQKTGNKKFQEDLQKMADMAEQEKVIKKIKAPDYLELTDEVFTNKDIRKIIFKNLDVAGLRKVMERGGVAMESVFEDLINLGDNISDIADKLEKREQRSVASWARNFEGINWLNSYGKSIKGTSWKYEDKKDIDAKRKSKKKTP